MEFNLSKVELSKNDLRRGLSLPTRPSEELAEFIGILIGDGYLYNNKRKYTIGIVGSPKTDKKYFSKIQKLIYNLFNIKTKVKKGGRGLRLIFGSKGTFLFLTKVINLEYGANKGQRVSIPSEILKDTRWTYAVIKGIFDTDGSVFTSNKRGSPNYPCVELTTTSTKLAEQIKNILIEEKFRVAGVRRYKHKRSRFISNKVSLYGKKNMGLWLKKIGFSNPIKQKKLLEILGGTDGTFRQQ